VRGVKAWNAQGERTILLRAGCEKEDRFHFCEYRHHHASSLGEGEAEEEGALTKDAGEDSAAAGRASVLL
jgi:hypothetical protein